MNPDCTPLDLPESKGAHKRVVRMNHGPLPLGTFFNSFGQCFVSVYSCLGEPPVSSPTSGSRCFRLWKYGVHGVHGVTGGGWRMKKLFETPKINGLLTLLYKTECPFGQIGHKLKPGKSWFHLSLGQGGVGEGVPGNARTLRGCLVLHHPLIMLASMVIATIYQGLSPQPFNHACRASSAWSLLMLGVGHPWAPEKLFGGSQAAPRHEKLWGYLGPISTASHDRTCKQDGVTSHSLHWSTSGSLGLSKPQCCFSGVSCLPGCWEGPRSWSHTPAWASVPPYPRLQKNTPCGSTLYFPSNSSLSPKLRKSEALLFTFTAFFSWALVLETQKPNEASLSLLLVNTSSPWVSKTTNNELCLVGSEVTDRPRCNNTGLFCTHT